MFEILIVILFVNLVILSFWCIPWQVHMEMTKENSKVCGKGNYKKFIEEFEKINWIEGTLYKNSYFDYGSDSEIHANIFRFNGIGMIMKTPWDYWIVRKYLDNKKVSHDWDK